MPTFILNMPPCGRSVEAVDLKCLYGLHLYRLPSFFHINSGLSTMTGLANEMETDVTPRDLKKYFFIELVLLLFL